MMAKVGEYTNIHAPAHTLLYIISLFVCLDYHGTDQVIARKEFEEGISKVLICTSVAEEGLNFVACSLVIMYNYVTGEVGEIQRAGE